METTTSRRRHGPKPIMCTVLYCVDWNNFNKLTWEWKTILLNNYMYYYTIFDNIISSTRRQDKCLPRTKEPNAHLPTNPLNSKQDIILASVICPFTLILTYIYFNWKKNQWLSKYVSGSFNTVAPFFQQATYLHCIEDCLCEFDICSFCCPTLPLFTLTCYSRWGVSLIQLI